MSNPDGLLAGSVALISGGAAGIGAAVVRRFKAEGAEVWINDLDAAGFEAISAEVNVDGMSGDASDPEFVNSWVETAVERYGRIDVLYNNVGVSRPGLVGEISDADWRFQQAARLNPKYRVSL